MTAQAILDEIRPLGSESYRKTLARHGVTGPCFGVKVSDLKKIQKRIKKDYQLALALYDTGVYDAMYLAGLIADDAQMTRRDLQRWVERCEQGGLGGSTVPWVAAGSPHGWTLALEWIDSAKDFVAGAGWTTLGCLAALKPDAELDLAALKQLLARVQRTIHQAPNSTRYQMNGFVIAVAAYVAPLTALALHTAEAIGRVDVDMGDTACEVPFAPDYIRKIQQRGAIGKKAQEREVLSGASVSRGRAAGRNRGRWLPLRRGRSGSP
jgi:3-methyladenine DNA glycosylase AlkD